jgi:hypothetical protein
MFSDLYEKVGQTIFKKRRTLPTWHLFVAKTGQQAQWSFIQFSDL